MYKIRDFVDECHKGKKSIQFLVVRFVILLLLSRILKAVFHPRLACNKGSISETLLTSVRSQQEKGIEHWLPWSHQFTLVCWTKTNQLIEVHNVVINGTRSKVKWNVKFHP